MNKIQKRIKKLSRKSTNAMVVGTAFGFLQEILGLFNTVFVVGNEKPNIKGRNLVYRENMNNTNNMTDIGTIFIDLAHLDKLEKLQNFWAKNYSMIFIEGNEVIEREFSTSLYDTGWRCTSQQGFFHVWEQMK